jgi:hypothetical protein
MFVVSMVAVFIVGATVSYVWTMGYYASEQYRLPEKPALSIEAVKFSAQNTSFFGIVVLNPSYSPQNAKIDKLAVLIGNEVLTDLEVSPNLPRTLEVGDSENFTVEWNWANYTGQAIEIVLFLTEGSGATNQTLLPYVGLSIEAHFNFTISTHFNVTVQNAETSVTYVDITRLMINHEVIPFENITRNGESVSFPYLLNSNQSVTFTCQFNWTKYRGKTVVVAVETLQGYKAAWQKEL